MASGNQLRAFLPSKEKQMNPQNHARVEIRNNQHVWVFPPGVDTEIILEDVVSHLYGATTGFDLIFCWGADLPKISGNVVWAAAMERTKQAANDTLHSADNFGVDYGVGAAGALDGTAVPATAADLKYTTLVVPKATWTAVAHDRVRLRVKRKGTDADDTLVGNALLVGLNFKET